MKAMIMAAGKGTRLGKITESVPKALVDINGRSILRIAVEYCSRYGFDDVIINVHHFADDVVREVHRLNREGFRISVSDESDNLLETEEACSRPGISLMINHFWFSIVI